MNHETITNIIIGLILIGAIFLIIRELVCWYWKINEGIDLQKKSIKNQEKIIELLTPPIIDNNIPYINRHEVK